MGREREKRKKVRVQRKKMRAKRKRLVVRSNVRRTLRWRKGKVNEIERGQKTETRKRNRNKSG